MNPKNTLTINLFEVIKSRAAISSDDGDLAFQRINSAFKNKMKVVVDFKNIDLIVSTFLNAAIGQIYSSYSSEYIRDHLSIQNMSNEDLKILKKVTERAKQYFSNKDDFEATIKGAF